MTRLIRAVLAGIVVLTEATTVWMNEYQLSATAADGRTVNFRIDPMNDNSVVKATEASSSYTFADTVAWDLGLVTIGDRDSVLGLSPKSTFIDTHQVVTIIPAKGKFIVGAYDASADCASGAMIFVPQAAGADKWKLPLFWNASTFESSDVEFDLGYFENSFIVPRPLSRDFYLHFQRQIQIFEDRGETYTTAQARTEVPVIHLTVGEFDVSMTPDEYVVGSGEPDTDFGFSQTRDPQLPQWVLSKMIVQLDATNNRVGVCIPA